MYTQSGKLPKISKYSGSKTRTLPWKILTIVDNVYKRFSFIICLTIIVTLILIATFWLHTAGLHQTIMLIYWGELFVPPWLLVIGVSQTSLMVGGFWSNALLTLREEETDPSAVCCGRGRMSCCLTVGIHASGISIPLSLRPVDVVRIKSYVDSLLNLGSAV